MIRRMRSRYPRRQKGMAIIEFAIVSTIFIVMLFAIAEGGRYIYSYGVVAHTAREGARYIAVRGSNAAADSRRSGDAPATDTQVENYLNSRSPLGNINVSVSWAANPDNSLNKDPGQVVSVTVTYNFTSFMTLFSPMTLTSTATSVIYF